MKRNSWPNPCNWVKSICSNFETHNRFRIETFASVTQTLKCRRRSMSAVDRETAAVHFTASGVIHSPERLQFLSIWRWWTRENEIWKQENSRHSEWEFIFFSFAGMAQFPSSFVFFWVQLYLNGDLIVTLKKETQSLVKIVFLHSKLTMNFKKRRSSLAADLCPFIYNLEKKLLSFFTSRGGNFANEDSTVYAKRLTKRALQKIADVKKACISIHCVRIQECQNRRWAIDFVQRRAKTKRKKAL